MSDSSTQSEFVVTARKWRPQIFSQVVGQEHISTTLANAILSGRVHHAYLFCGSRGVGKTTTARIFARALNCTNPIDGVEPCNHCDSCLDILSGRSLDVIEIDGASNNSVDDVRKLRENAKYPPVHGRYKMYIIDEVHMLSTSAFNALLKTLEEPPPHLLFMFATTEAQKVPATIVSRCQRFDFRRMQIDDIVRHLAYIAEQEKVQIDEASLIAIAKKGDGSMRDSQSIFDQVRAFCGDNVAIKDLAEALHLIDEDFFFNLSAAIVGRDSKAMFELVRQVMDRGYDVQECLGGLNEHMRNLLSILATGDTALIESSSEGLKRYSERASEFRQPDILRIMAMISATEAQIRFSAQPRYRLELLLVQLASLDSTVEIAQVLAEIRDLKKNGSKISMLSSPVHATMPSPPATRVVTPAPASSLTASPQPEHRSNAHKGNSSSVSVGTKSRGNGAAGSTAKALERSDEGLNTANGTADTVFAHDKANVGTSSTTTRQYTPSAKAARSAHESTVSATTFVEGPQVPAQVIEAGWQEFVKSLPTSLAAIKLGLSTRDLSSVRFFEGEILILNSEKFLCDELNARRAPLSSQLEKFFGNSIRMRIVHTQDIHQAQSALEQEDESGVGASVKNVPATAQTSSSNSSAATHTAPSHNHGNAAQSNGEKLPIEKSLVELFGAKKIPLQSV